MLNVNPQNLDAWPKLSGYEIERYKSVIRAFVRYQEWCNAIPLPQHCPLGKREKEINRRTRLYVERWRCTDTEHVLIPQWAWFQAAFNGIVDAHAHVESMEKKRKGR